MGPSGSRGGGRPACLVDDRAVPVSAREDEVLLDVLRDTLRVTAVKEGCREGDCGACVVLVGAARGGRVDYRPLCACLTPFGDVAGCHVVTLAGLRQTALTPVQRALLEEGGTQCGFCTPGFAVSLTGYLLNTAEPDARGAVEAMDGNLCRCTGHVGIIRAAHRVVDELASGASDDPVVPPYFAQIPARLAALEGPRAPGVSGRQPGVPLVAGGTDAWVRHRSGPGRGRLQRIARAPHDDTVTEEPGRLRIPATLTVEELRRSAPMRRNWPRVVDSLVLFGSTPIRNRATVGGNIVTGSPIGDLTCMLMALDAVLVLRDGDARRELPLRALYTGYKQLAMGETEVVDEVLLPLPRPQTRFGYEKLSRRRHLDVASVCCAVVADVDGAVLSRVRITVGGVAPMVQPLRRTEAALEGASARPGLLAEVLPVAQSEISPISDVRGTAHYKRLALRQVLAAHIERLLPGVLDRRALP